MRTINSLITVLLLSFATISTVGCATGGDEYADFEDGESSATAPGKIDLYKSSDNQWRFRVVSGNGRILLSSEAYTTKASAENGIESVLENGIDPAQYVVNKTANGKYNLRLRAKNYEIIAFTQGYSTKSNATRAIDACVRALETYLDAKYGADDVTQQN